MVFGDAFLSLDHDSGLDKLSTTSHLPDPAEVDASGDVDKLRLCIQVGLNVGGVIVAQRVLQRLPLLFH